MQAVLRRARHRTSKKRMRKKGPIRVVIYEVDGQPTFRREGKKCEAAEIYCHKGPHKAQGTQKVQIGPKLFCPWSALKNMRGGAIRYTILNQSNAASIGLVA